MNYSDRNVSESIWIECRTTNSSATKNNQQINFSISISSNSCWKNFQLASFMPLQKINPLVLIVENKINVLRKNERECLETLLIPDGRNVMNKEPPTRIVGSSKTLLDYIITDHLNAETFESHVSDSPFRTPKNNILLIIEQHRSFVIFKSN